MPDLHSRPVSTDDLVTENTHAIQQLADLLAVLPKELYQQSFGARKQHIIGKHVRHIIDHYLAFIRAVSTSSIAPLDYENRQREEILEQDNHAARDRLLGIVGALDRLTQASAKTSLHMEHTSDEQRGAISTTVDRELVFLASHTIHHMAIIAMLAELEGVEVPDGFGVHPSTLRHQRKLQIPLAISA